MKFKVIVEQEVEVELDETKFTDEFMKEFSKYICDYDLEQHAEHIAWLVASGRIDISLIPEFIEGYGMSDEMGIKASVNWTDTFITER